MRFNSSTEAPEAEDPEADEPMEPEAAAFQLNGLGGKVGRFDMKKIWRFLTSNHTYSNFIAIL